ncbi:hypothetical protein [Streptomyces microflavus]|uniref:hypothetical protein n=1 Tax=Streptomyces microflavus TaxID=1919 RepID=UPI0036883224
MRKKLRLGQRGAFLLVVGFIQIVLGWSTYVTEPETLRAYAIAGEIGPGVVGLVQIGLGAVACVNAFWPPGKDRWGFSFAIPAPVFWATDAVISSAFGFVPWELAVRSAAFWAGYAVLILLGSGMQGIKE